MQIPTYTICMATQAEVKDEVVGGHGYLLAGSSSTSPLLRQGSIHFPLHKHHGNLLLRVLL
jgi:hypothetical protein